MGKVRYIVATIVKLTIVLVCVLFILNPLTVRADDERLDVLVVLPTNNEQTETEVHQHLLDMLVGHFTTNVTFRNSGEVQSKDVKGVSHVIYYGYVKEELPNSFIEIMENYQQEVLVIGYNVDQLLKDFELKEGTENYTSILYKQKEYDVVKQELLMIDDNKNTNVIVEAVTEQGKVPLFTQKGNKWYYSSTNLFAPSSNIFTEVLHEVFEEDHKTSRQAYLRLEDIHPGINAKELERVAAFLKKEKIPYMVSISPVYINSKTEELYKLSDTEDVVKVLNDMQDDGASFVLHGYSDQYGDLETGSGFEFWDKEENKPLDIRERGTYTDTVQFIKHATLREKLEAGIQELVDYGIYPIAFEAPHYAMSQQGYKTISEYFSTYVGQVQLTDNDWRMMTESPVMTNPSFLHGMTLLPETIRYVRYDEPESFKEIQNKIDEMLIVRDGVIGGFYHPFMGMEQLQKLVYEMKDIPGITWLDVKEGEHSVHMEDYTIQMVDQKAELIPTNKKTDEETSGESGLNHFLRLLSSHFGWVGVGLTITGLVAFLSLYMARRRVRTM
ncbi:DUF2334 domain-containing protein [Oceanobacillus manasiensis]|uniref:DUF2334 domain-containing protein n=1 Tax=Oceanobacillus manasiensis TaxID=586413 RepID=UPI0005A8E7D8|nr:DUF2334 domain-containing protein [Oceanobacillus manasiensis]